LLNILRLSSVIAPATAMKSNTAHYQERIVANFPTWSITTEDAWISKVQAKAFSRLLVGLNTKTIVLQKSRKNKSNADSAQIVTLSGPLSKHSPFLLVNFLKYSADSHLYISSDIRKELLVGVQELIQSMNKFEKDAIMKGFLKSHMEAERVLLRELWKDYDKIRYKGD